MQPIIELPLENGRKLLFDPNPLINYFNSVSPDNYQQKADEIFQMVLLLYGVMKQSNPPVANGFVGTHVLLINSLTVEAA